MRYLGGKSKLGKHIAKVICEHTDNHSVLVEPFCGGCGIGGQCTMSHGITLTRSSTIVWYAPVFSNDTYTQANGRIYRQGQTRQCTVVNLSSSDIETEIYRRLKERQSVQEKVLELFRR